MTTTTASARWERLRADLADAGIETRVIERAFAQTVYGRPRAGVTRSIEIAAGDVLVGIHDKWWSKNPDKWLGWTVHAEGRADSIVRGETGGLKTRAGVVAAVQQYLAPTASTPL